MNQKNLAIAYTNRGNSYHKKGEADLAIADYGRAIGLNPKYADAFSNRGLAYAQKRQFARSIQDSEQAIRLTAVLHGVQKVAPDATVIVVREGHGIGAGAAAGTVGRDCLGAAVLPANYTFVSGDNGVHTFSVTLNTVGTRSITATDTVTASITGTQSGIVVNPAAAQMAEQYTTRVASRLSAVA